MTKGLNIVSRLTFENIPDGTLPTYIPDENQYSNYSYTKSGTVTVETIDGIKFIKLNSTTAKIYSPLIITDQSKKNFQAEFDVIFDSLKADTHLVSIGVTTLANALRVVASNNPAQGLRLINGNNQISSYYRFENNKKYTICVGFKDNVISMYIDGTIIGYFYSEEFINSLNITTPSNIILGASLNNTNDVNVTLYGKLGNINISSGPSVKHEESYTKYGTNLVSFLNFENLAGIGTYKTGIESVYKGLEWRGVESAAYSNGYGNIKNISTDLTGEFTVMFSLKKFKVANANILKYGNYSIDYVAGFIPVPDPDVIVNEYTTSALNFENGLIDQVGTTIWQKESTSDVSSVNKIFGDNSFETKALGDGLYTNSNIITGATTPFTIEFYALIKQDTPNNYNYKPLFTIDGGTSDQGFYRNKNTGAIVYYRHPNNALDFSGKIKLNFNEINKITITYDSSAVRVFINNTLDLVVGTNNAIIHESALSFYRSKNTSLTNNVTYGLLDNINIHDGIATKVRDPDHHEEFLVVDLAFDGENNSTKIVDNGTLKSNWAVNDNAKISTDQKFDGFSSLYLDGGSTIKLNEKLYLEQNDFTISFDLIMSTTNFSVSKPLFTVDTTDNSKKYYFGIYRVDNALTIARKRFTFIRNDWYGLDTSQIKKSITPNSLFSNSIVNNTTLPYRISIIRKNNTLMLYINDVLEDSTLATDSFNFENILIGGGGNDNCYIKNFKIYKDAAVIPEDPTGKIQLDFDNNVIDKYGNSTWTNNGVTFDQVNSVKGHAAYFQNNDNSLTSNSSDLNFGSNNFRLSLDCLKLPLRPGDQRAMNILGNNVKSDIQNAIWWYKGMHNDNKSFLNYKDIPTNKTRIINNDYPNVYYSDVIERVGPVLREYKNDVLFSVTNLSSQVFNFIEGGFLKLGSSQWSVPDNFRFNGYIDNFIAVKNQIEISVVDRPAVHLPLETNAINTGFTPLTINSIGNPTYTTIDGKKCIKFESGKYLTINSNNIFNLGTSSDFYIEFDFYIIDSSILNVFLSNHTLFTNNSSCILYANKKIEFQFNNGTLKIYPTINTCEIGQFNNFKLYRMNNVIYMNLNGVETIINENYNINFSISNLFLGKSGWSSTDRLNGYMSNFKMFVGTSEIPESYNDKKVLYLDFKPTGKSYLFKDNNNKCVIHPVNITQRDYQDSQYCCTFNGVDQYLQLGKNDLFNFGLDDFVINIKFKINEKPTQNVLLLNNNADNVYNRAYIAINGLDNSSPFKLEFGITNTTSPVVYYQIRSNNDIQPNVIYDFKIISSNGNISMILNDEIQTMTLNNINNVNFNYGDNTYIAKSFGTDLFFKGTIYSIKVLRNTTNLSLLEDKNVDVIIGDTTLTLSNGTDSQEVIFDNKNQNDFRFVHSNDSTKLIVNEQILEVPNVENELNELSLFTDFNAEAKDIKTYNIAFEDEDTFSGNVPIHTQFGEIEDIDTVTDIFHVVDQGDFIVNGFFEGRPEDSRYQIRNRFDYIVMHSDSGPFNYNGINKRYIDDYEIYLPVTNETMPIPTEPMIRGYITVSITPTECDGINFGVKVFRRSDNKLIGIYNFNNYICTIDNLDCNKRYDCIIFDQDVNLESRCLSNRTPIPY